MDKKPLTTERLEIMLAETLGTTAARGEQASIEVNASIFVSVLTEVLARRMTDRRALELLSDVSSDNVFETIGRLKVIISGDYS